MIPYARLDPKAGVEEYEPGETSIRVRFKNSTIIYTYTNRSAGSPAIKEMNRLATLGKGLSTYIAKNKPSYESKTG